MRIKNSIWCSLLALAWAAVPARAASYGIAVAEGQGEPGRVAPVAVHLDSAAEVASLEFQVNYDSAVLTVAGVTNPPGSLGEAFALDYEAEDGRLVVRLYRGDGLVSGSGTVCQVLFAVNAGAEPGLWCDLAVADAAFYTQFGADLRWNNAVSRENSKFWAVFSSTNDADHDGLSDYEEQMSNGSPDYDSGVTDTDVNNADTDGDGAGDRAEHIAGTDGNNEEAYLALEMESQGGGTGPATFRWRSATGRVYSIYFSTNLMDPWPTVPWLEMVGDGTEKSFANESEDEPLGYFRLKVEEE